METEEKAQNPALPVSSSNHFFTQQEEKEKRAEEEEKRADEKEKRAKEEEEGEEREWKPLPSPRKHPFIDELYHI